MPAPSPARTDHRARVRPPRRGRADRPARRRPAARRLAGLVCAAAAAALVCGSAAASVGLALAAGPSPTRPGELLELDVSLTNPGPLDREHLAVHVELPPNVLPFDAVRAGVDCPGGDCDPGEVAVALVPVLEAGRSRSLTLRLRVDPAAPDGGILPVAVTVREDEDVLARVERQVVVDAARTLELSVQETRDPVPDDGSRRWSITWGRRGGATTDELMLALPVPPGILDVAADSGGVLLDGAIRWQLGAVAPGDSGEVGVWFNVQGNETGAILPMEATLTSAAGELVRDVEHLRIDSASLGVPHRLRIVPEVGVVRPGDVTEVVILLQNIDIFAEPLPASTLSLAIPDGLRPLPDGDQRFDCPGDACEGGERAVIELGPVPDGSSTRLRIPFIVDEAVADGTVIPIEATLDGLSGPAVQTGAAITVGATRAVDLRLVEAVDPAPVDARSRLEVVYAVRDGSPPLRDVFLEVDPGAFSGMVFPADGGRLDQETIRWPLGTLEPGDTGRRRFEIGTGSVFTGAVRIPRAVLRSGDERWPRARTATTAAVRGPADGRLTVELVPGTSPVRHGEIADAEAIVVNEGPGDAEDVRLEILPGSGLAPLDPAAVGGDCGDASCPPGVPIAFELGDLPAGTGRRVVLPVRPIDGGSTARLAAISAVATDAGGLQGESIVALVVDEDRVHDLTIVETDDPDLAGGRRTLTPAWATRADGPGLSRAELELRLPPGSELVGASDDAIVEGDVVRWTISSPPGGGGERRVTVTAPAAPPPATTAEARLRPAGATWPAVLARETTRVAVAAPGPLDVEVGAVPNAAAPGRTVVATLAVTNLGDRSRTGVRLELDLPVGVSPADEVDLGVDCPGATCEPGEPAAIEIGALAPGATARFDLPLTIADDPGLGHVIRLDATVADDAGGQATDAEAILVAGPVDLAGGGDANDDGTVGLDDLLLVLATWGPCAEPDDCPADADADGTIGMADVLVVLAAWE